MLNQLVEFKFHWERVSLKPPSRVKHAFHVYAIYQLCKKNLISVLL